MSLVLGLGLEHSCPRPRECLSSERLFLALASDFFCVLGLEPCVLDSTSGPWPREGLSFASKIFCVLGLEPYVLDSTSTKAKDQLFEERPFRGQEQQCSRPRIKDNAQVFSKKKRSSCDNIERFL